MKMNSQTVRGDIYLLLTKIIGVVKVYGQSYYRIHNFCYIFDMFDYA